MNYRQKVGKFGETLAKSYLARHGYRIVDENVKNSYQEIDIIASQDKYIIFVEVKTRTTLHLGSADTAMDFKKTNNLKKAINNYIYENNIRGNFIRLDLISIDINRVKKTAKIKHYKDIA